MKLKKKTIIISLLVLIAILITIFIITAFSIADYGKKDEKRHADVIIVLGAAATDEGPSPVFRERISHGITLYNEGYAEKLIFTGGLNKGNTKSEALIAKEYAISCGVPEEDILIEERSEITEENLKNAKEIMDEQGYTDALIVSDPLHMKRSMLLCADAGIVGYSCPTPTTMYRSVGTQIQFVLREAFFFLGYLVLRIFV